jgi:NADH-quinone oxidoreductase subunit L
MHHEQDIFRMGGLGRKMPVVFWTFLAASLCLAGVPPSGGFFSKDGIMAEVWARGGAFYDTLYVVGMITVFLTVIYTFRMLFIVFGDRDEQNLPTATLKKLPSVMTYTLIPLSLLAFFGGLFNLPGYLGHGLLGSFMSSLNTTGEHLSSSTELWLQGVAILIVVAAIFVSWRLYGRQNRTAYIARAEQPAQALTAFLQAGWYVDSLYFFLFVRPFERLAEILWQKVDEGVIDDSLDRMAVGFGRTGQFLGRWGSGRVSVYLLSLAAGAMLIIVWFAWEVLL